MEASVSNSSHPGFAITKYPSRLLHAQVAELRPWDSQTLFSHRSPAGCRESVTPRFRKLLVGRFPHVLHREAHATVTYLPIRALDSNPHDTADCSDAVSPEHRHLEGVESSKKTADCRSEIVAPKLVDIRSIDNGSSPDSTVGMYGFVMGPNQQADAWDSESIHAPVVRRYLSDNEERWMLWYSGKSQGPEGDAGNGSREVMGVAISSNGAHWKRGNGGSESTELIKDGVGKVLDCSENWWAFDTEITRPSDVLVMSSLKARTAAGVYWMYYTGGCSEEIEIPKPKNLPMNLPDFKYFNSKVVVVRTRPGLTMSHDGRNWARIEGDHHSGSLFDVGGEKEWDFLFIADPHVVYVNADDLRLYYHSFDLKAGCFSVGYARSRDAMKWIKFGKILGGGPLGSFDELGVKSPQVVAPPSGKGFLMIYEGVAADGRTSFGLAQSKDGLSGWERCSDGPVFNVAEEPNAWDSKEIHSPCLVHMDGNEWQLYYQGVSRTGKSGFGMAQCTDGKLLNFKRCHGLHL
ncbi:hypothetical protein L7F22_041797 [Adiantum nelumboides]|nr:hypothetical protein [Adiantum nelumboides]